VKILILSANPKDTDKLRLDEEVREIRAALRRAKSRDQFEIVTELAVRVDDLLPILLDHEPQIVHFSGHGAGSQGLALEHKSGKVQLVSTAALVGLFKAFKSKIECVFLNACYSEAQADAIHQHIDCVVGMNTAIGDRAAINFAVGFYTAFFSGRSYKNSFELAGAAVDLQGIPESSTPMLKSRQPTDAASSSTSTILATQLSQTTIPDLIPVPQADFSEVAPRGFLSATNGEWNRINPWRWKFIKR
jgi:hypothetical protein